MKEGGLDRGLLYSALEILSILKMNLEAKMSVPGNQERKKSEMSD